MCKAEIRSYIMTELMTYGLSAMLACFVILTFILSRIPTDIFPEEYEFALDPFWYIIGVMFLGGSAAYFMFPHLPDMVHKLKYIQILLPFIFAVLIYFCFLFEFQLLGNLVMLGGAAIVSYMLPKDFALFPQYLTFWQDRLVTILLLFIFAKGLGLLNGIGAIASMQFATIMASIAILAHFNALPYVLGVVAFAYLGTIFAFAFFNWPPERLYISISAFEALGFIMACLMLVAAEEFAEAPICIAGAYIITEILFALYDRYINNNKTDALFMNASYFKTSQDGQYDVGVARGIIKILIINTILALTQILAKDQYALPIFAVLLDFWLLSVLSGDSKPQSMFSITKWGINSVSGLLKKDKETKKKKKGKK